LAVANVYRKSKGIAASVEEDAKELPVYRDPKSL